MHRSPVSSFLHGTLVFGYHVLYNRIMDFSINDLLLCGGTTDAPSEQIESAATVVNQMLERSKDGPFRLDMLKAQGGGFTVDWVPSGFGAGVVSWFEGDEILAVSVICSGLDPQADEAAISRIFSEFGPRAVVKEQIRGMARPFMSTLYNSPRSLTEMPICGFAVGFGRSFFGRIKDNELRSVDRAPQMVRSPANELVAASEPLETELGQAPTDVEAARRPDIPQSEFEKMGKDTSAATLDLSEDRISYVHSGILAPLEAQMAALRTERQQAQVVAQRPSKILFAQSYQGFVIDVKSDSVIVAYETDDDEVRHEYLRTQFKNGVLPELGQRIASHVQVTAMSPDDPPVTRQVDVTTEGEDNERSEPLRGEFEL